MNKKKLVALGLIVVLLLTAIGGTLAYFTDTDEATNVMTIGNVDIKLREANEDKTLLDDAYRAWLATYEAMPGITVAKRVWVDNDGSQPAYVRVVIEIDKDLEPAWSENWETQWKHNYVEKHDSFVHTFELKAPVAKGASTVELLTALTLKAEVTNETADDIYNIPVNVYAIQSAGLTAAEAYEQLDSITPKVVVVKPAEDETVQAALNNVLADVKDDIPTEINLPTGEYTLLVKNSGTPNLAGKDITFTGAEDAVMDLTGIVGATWHTQDTDATITFEGLTIHWGEDNEGYQGFTNAEKVTYKDCTIYGTQFMGGDAEFINCVFEATDTQENGYAVYGRGAGTLTFTGCTFNTEGRAIMLYQDQTTEVNVVMTDCVFIDNGGYTSKPKAVVETGDGSSKTSKFNITITNCTYEGFETNNSSSPLWGNKDNIPADRLSVTIDGASVDLEDTRLHINKVEDLIDFAKSVNERGVTYSGKTVVLNADIDLAGIAWTPIGQTGATQFLGTFDGQNHTIKNLYVDSTAQTGGTYSSGLFGWIERHGNDANYLLAVKDLKVEGAVVKGHHNIGVIAGYLIGVIDNCHVSDAELINTHANDDACGDKTGVIVGNVAEANGKVSDCSATNCKVAGGRDAGQIAGSCIYGTVENCKATNVTVTATDGCTGANVRNELIGRTN